jgi:hypothetical protein
MSTFSDKIEQLDDELNIPRQTIVYQYLIKDTKASDRGSKSRRSLATLYALYVLCNTWNNNQREGTSFTALMEEMRQLPFGSKLQNHALDNRLNDKIRRGFGASDLLLPVQPMPGKKRKISPEFLTQHGMNADSAALFITRAIDLYVAEITENQNAFLTEIEGAASASEILEFVEKSWHPNADARLFEVVSYSVLKLYYARLTVKINDEVKPYELFKTGRTNANDGGIDFVLRPEGRFFQVTEVLDFKKYFLDFDKTNKFPISFVIKTLKTPDDAFNTIRNKALKSMEEAVADSYMALFEEIITVPTLQGIVSTVAKSETQIQQLKATICDNFKLEYGLLD